MGNLVLSRRRGERLRIRVKNADGSHTDLWVGVVEMKGGRNGSVRLAIQAPQECLVLREELILRRERSSRAD